MDDRNTSIRRSQLKPIQYDDLDATNAAVDNYIPSYDQATGKFTWVVNAAGVTAHNDLSSIQGGTTNEYYHLTVADYNELSDLLGGITVVSGNIITFTSFPITPSSAPTTDYEVSNKKYVDDSLAGISSDKISEGDSLVEVVDLGTGYIKFQVDNTEQLRLVDGKLYPITDDDIALGDTTHRFTELHLMPSSLYLGDTHITEQKFNRNELNIVLNAFRIAINGSLSQLGMIDGITDEYEDETGINTVSSTNESYDATNDLYSPVSGGTNIKLLLHLNGLDEATTTIDSSASAHTITFNGTAQLDTAFKKWGTAALLLDGDSDYLSIPDSADWDIVGSNSDDWTIDFRVKFTDHSGWEDIIRQVEDIDNYWYILHRSGGYGWRFQVEDNNAIIIDTGYGGEITDTNWHHIAMCKVADKYAIYVDGTQINYTQDSSIGTFAGSLYIGGETLFGVYFDGHLDDIRITHENAFSANPVASTNVIDSYSESNKDADTPMLSGENEQRGQAFTLSSIATITSVKFYATEQGTAPGNIVAKLYAATGTVGTDAIPTGSVLATSNTVAASTLPASPTYALVEFTFPTPYVASAGDYCVLIEYTAGDATDRIRIGYDSSSPSHGGNLFYTHTAGSGWLYQTGIDMCFYLYGYTDTITIPPSEHTDPGVTNMTLISNSNTAEVQPDSARIVLFEEDVDSVTLNTDLKAYVSRDGGTTYTQVTLSDEGDYESGKRILTGTVDISAQPAGTSMIYKIETLNTKDLKLHGVGELWD